LFRWRERSDFNDFLTFMGLCLVWVLADAGRREVTACAPLSGAVALMVASRNVQIVSVPARSLASPRVGLAAHPMRGGGPETGRNPAREQRLKKHIITWKRIFMWI
jgi:hypothetical protein